MQRATLLLPLVLLALGAAACSGSRAATRPASDPAADPSTVAAPSPAASPEASTPEPFLAVPACSADAECGAGSRCEAGACQEARCELTVHFGFDEVILRKEARDALASGADCIRARGWSAIRVEGHADERGTNEYNLHLGQRRAESVARYLTNLGLGARAEAVSFGEEVPAVEGDDEAAWARNRRAEVRDAAVPAASR
jgi:peptidoglycan-associated lipoprotein